MSKNSSANRTELASGPGCRVELDEQGTLHVYSGDTCLELEREACEDLAMTLARAVITLAKRQSVSERRATLRLV